MLVGSLIGHIAVPDMAAYVLSKWGVRGLVRQLRVDNRDRPGLRFGYVAPGGVDTPIYDQAATYGDSVGRPPFPVQDPERVAARVLAAADHPWRGGQTSVANQVIRFGFRALPPVYDRLVGPAVHRGRPGPRAPGRARPRQRPGLTAGAQRAAREPRQRPGRHRPQPRRAAPPTRLAMTGATWDAVVVGAGPNGLVAANRLLDAGWSVLLLEAQPDVGGAVRSDRELHPDFVQDTFSAFYPLAASSPTIRSFDLEQHGLAWRHAPSVLGHPFPDGSWAVLHRDREATAAGLDARCAGDGDAWLELCAQWDRVGPHLIGALLTPFPPLRHGAGALAALRHVGGLGFVKTLLTPVAELTRQRFGGEAARVLLAGNAAHADIPLDAPGSALMGMLLAMMGQTVGFPVPEGGAGELDPGPGPALPGRRRRDPYRRRGHPHRGGRGTGRGRADRRRRAVRRTAAPSSPTSWRPTLYTRLLDPEDVPGRVRTRWAPSSWTPARSRSTGRSTGRSRGPGRPTWRPGTVHVADSVDRHVAGDEPGAGRRGARQRRSC